MRDFRARIRGLSLALLLGWSNVGWSESEYTGVVHTYVSLMLSDSLAKTRVGAKGVVDDFAGRFDLADLAAELLSRPDALEKMVGATTRTSNVRVPLDADLNIETYRLLLRIIRRTKSRRYRSVLEDVRDNAPSPAMYRANSLALKSLTNPADQPFIPGSIDLAALQEQLAVTVEDSKSKRNARDFRSLNIQEGIDSVYEKIGLPDRLTIVTRSVKFNVGRVQRHELLVTYEKLGTIEFNRMHQTWGIVEINQHVMNLEQLGFGNLLTVEFTLLYGSSGLLRRQLTTLIQQQSCNASETNAAANRLWHIRNSGEKAMISAAALTIRLISECADSRYSTFLSRVADTVTHDKTKKRARSAADKLANEGAQFEPTDIVMPDGFTTDQTQALAAELTVRQGDDLNLRVLAQALTNGTIEVQRDVWDAIATRLRNNFQDKNDYTQDSMAWVLIALASHKNPRYRALLEQMAAEDPPSKIRSRIKKALKELPNEKVEQFLPRGSVPASPVN